MHTLRLVDTAGSGAVRYELWEGDNLDGIEIVAAQIAAGTRTRFDLAYLDPPYNTRGNVRYRDRFGARGNHDVWRAFLRPRLERVRDVLTSTGICAVSIDTRELATCISLCDEVFGERHRLAVICQRVKAAAGLSPATVMDVCEYLLVYAADIASWRGRTLYRWEPMTELGEYRRRLVDIDGGVLESTTETCAVYRHDARIERVGPDVLVSGDVAGVFCTTNAQGVSALKQHVPRTGLYRVEHVIAGGAHAGSTRTTWFRNGRVVVFLDGHTRFGTRLERRVRETTLWDDHWYQGLGAEGGVRFTSGKKPVRMLQRLLGWCGPDAAVLDMFAGSASMVHATAAANTADGGGRTVVAITSEEDRICSTVAWPRVRGVLTGALADGTTAPALHGRAAYYRLEADGASEHTT